MRKGCSIWHHNYKLTTVSFYLDLITSILSSFYSSDLILKKKLMHASSKGTTTTVHICQENLFPHNYYLCARS